MASKPNLYTAPAWRRFRAAIIERDHNRCCKCGVDVSGPGQARVDHRVRVSDGGSMWDPNNARTLCARCDNQGHAEKGTGSPTRQERFGELVGCDRFGMPYSRMQTRAARQ
jgi:5-methylcytosine-specific restriction endonuclease McrA